MELINSKKLLRVGVQCFDEEHTRLVEITNQFHASIKAGVSRQALQEALDKLSEFAVRHFESEESLLEQHGYAALETHRDAHRLILHKLVEIQTSLQNSTVPVQHSVMQFLLDWLTMHTKTEDKLYGPFLNNKGVF